VLRVRAVFVDLDGAPPEPAMSWEPPPHLTVESSPGKWHLYWLVDGMPLEQFGDVQKQLAERFAGDKAVCDIPRVMRVPGFYHHKKDPFISRLHHVAADCTPYSAALLLSALGIESERASPKPSSRKVVASTSTIMEGSRNKELMRIAGRLHRSGVSSSELLEQLLKANAERCSPPLDEDEVTAIAKRVSSYATSRKDAAQTMNDTANAKRFVEQHGQDIRFEYSSENWLLWRDGCWSVDNTDQVIELSKKTALSIYQEAAEETGSVELRQKLGKHAEQSLNHRRLRSMVQLAASDPKIIVPIEALDADDMLLGVRNGVVDLRTGTFRAATREDLVTLRCETAFDPEAKSPVFERFLFRVMGGDPELIRFMQRLVGYALTGKTIEQCLAFLYGDGANGKSTFLDIIMRVMGDYAAQIQPESLMTRRSGGSASSDLARLVGKRLVVSNEIREGSHLEENLIKQITGGDRMTARFLYKGDFEFSRKYSLLMAGNHQPVIKGDDNGIWRRIHLVPFTQTIPVEERDRHLGEKLGRELAGILN
jgi:putative DNA primase/helicase